MTAALSAADAMALRPAGGYGLILADPPWAWAARSDKGLGKSPEAHYRTMSDAEIAAMSVNALSAPDALGASSLTSGRGAPDCLLRLWRTWPKLPVGAAVLDAWGFRYATGAVWHKTTVTGKTAFGTGYLLRSASEPVLLGVRGAPRLGSRSERNVIMAPTREHKPQARRDLRAAGAAMPRRAAAGAVREDPAAGLGCLGQRGEQVRGGCGMNNPPLRRPINYYGSKARLCGRIHAPIPPGPSTWVDLFCGSGIVTLTKPRHPREVINDLNGDVVNLFDVTAVRLTGGTKR